MNRGNIHRMPGFAPEIAPRRGRWHFVSEIPIEFFGAVLVLLLVLAVIMVMSGCGNSTQRRQIADQSCVRNRLNAAAIAYDEAKARFAEHFKVRSETSLRFAYMSSLDSTRLAVSIRGCFDFVRGHVKEARSITRSNRILRHLVRSNLRDSDAQQAIGIFGDQYREIFKNDID